MTLSFKPGKAEYLTLKKDIYDEVAVKMVPEDVLTRVRKPKKVIFSTLIFCCSI
jgi:hypothetical protein